jgi:hypothetical protein
MIFMTWSEIKTAVEQSGIKDDDDVSVIQCQLHDGNKRMHVLRLGRFIKIVEDFSEESNRDASGCAC